MAKKKKSDKYPTYHTPLGRLVFPFLQEARDFEGDEKFAFSTGFILKGKEAAELEKFVDDLLDEAQRQFKTKKVFYTPYGENTDENDEVIEGETLFKFKVAATTETKRGSTWHRKPACFHFKGGEAVKEAIGGGTMARVAYQTYIWKNPGGVGVTLQPTAIMVHELVELGLGGRNASDFGFETEAKDSDEGGAAAMAAEGDGPDGADF